MKLGIDLGGTKIEIIALDDSGNELLRRRVPTPQGNYYETLQAIAQLVRDAEAELGQSGSLGIGTPGSLSRATGRLKNSNSVALNGQPILQDLEALLQREIKISNDANCFALSEATDGAAAGAEVVFGVILGTGVGAGIVVNGRPQRHRRRMGAQSAALAATARTPRPGMLLRQAWLHRNLPLRAGHGEAASDGDR